MALLLHSSSSSLGTTKKPLLLSSPSRHFFHPSNSKIISIRCQDSSSSSNSSSSSSSSSEPADSTTTSSTVAPPSSAAGLGFGSTITSKKQQGKKERASIVRRTPLGKPNFESQREDIQEKERSQNESAFLLAWFGLGAIIIVEGIALAASVVNFAALTDVKTSSIKAASRRSASTKHLPPTSGQTSHATSGGPSSTSVPQDNPPPTQKWGDLRDDPEDLENIDVTGTGDTHIAKKPRHGKGKSLDALDVLMEESRKAGQKLKRPVSPGTLENHDLRANEMAELDRKTLAARAKYYETLSHNYNKEVVRRLTQPIDDEVGLKKKIRELESAATVQNSTLEFTKEVARKAEVALEACQKELKELRTDRDGQLETKNKELEEQKVKIGELTRQVDDLTAEAKNFPNLLTQARAEAVQERLASAEMEQDLTFLMRLALSGGYTMGVDEIRSAYDDVNIDVKSLRSNHFYDPNAQRSFSIISDDFQKGVEIRKKYAPPEVESPVFDEDDDIEKIVDDAADISKEKDLGVEQDNIDIPSSTTENN